MKEQAKPRQKPDNKTDTKQQKSKEKQVKSQKRNLRSGKDILNTFKEQDSIRPNKNVKDIKKKEKKVCDFDLIK